MVKELLDYDYDLTCRNLVDIDKTVNGFISLNSEFLNDKLKSTKIKVLTNNNDRQIFKTKDGRYILEVEDFKEGTVDYFYSFDINDLI